MAGELESLLGGIFWNEDGDDIPFDSREILKYNYFTGKLCVGWDAEKFFMFWISLFAVCAQVCCMR